LSFFVVFFCSRTSSVDSASTISVTSSTAGAAAAIASASTLAAAAKRFVYILFCFEALL
jgi:hypothetical protein